jgi:hypothetical protein
MMNLGEAGIFIGAVVVLSCVSWSRRPKRGTSASELLIVAGVLEMLFVILILLNVFELNANPGFHATFSIDFGNILLFSLITCFAIISPLYGVWHLIKSRTM